MTLEELVNETLVQKNRRLRQAKCKHEEVYSSTVMSCDGIFTNAFCFDCGQWMGDHAVVEQPRPTREAPHE